MVSCHALTRAGLHQLLSVDPCRVVVVDPGRDQIGSEPDVVIYDLAGLADAADHELADELAKVLSCAAAPVVGVQPHRRMGVVERALAAGVAAVVPMSTTSAELLDTVVAVAGGRTMTSSAWRVRHRRHLSQAFGLTGRELDILELIAAGLSNHEVGRRLHLSENSIKTYVRTAYRRIGAQSRSQAVLWCLDHAVGHRLLNSDLPTTF